MRTVLWCVRLAFRVTQATRVRLRYHRIRWGR